jgi:hypothetical protein
MADFLTSAVQGVLWPYLRSVGFRKVTARKFAREKNDIFQQVWIDANGVSGAQKTRIVLCCNFPFSSVSGYMDPHGFQLCRGKVWDMSEQESAVRSMQDAVEALKRSELNALDEICNFVYMLSSLEVLERPPQDQWHSTSVALYNKWLRGDAETLAMVTKNKRALNL